MDDKIKALAWMLSPSDRNCSTTKPLKQPTVMILTFGHRYADYLHDKLPAHLGVKHVLFTV